ncbi:MAG TPA: electron-transfer flavoprotein:ubiquinone oxidoreductase [Gaiellaceae bacterium]|nr:electron-transfer flavoprotein:ubiquinone oxidoreductase [Gaiellaceae bacterium]
MIRPADYPPPAVDPFGAPTDPEPVEVDVAIVGAGPAGLAAAIRLGQLAPHLSVAVLEKGTAVGSHLLSGAVVRPGPLRELVGDFPSYGEVPGEAVYLLTQRRAVRVPTPPTMRNEGNVVVSLSQLGRWLAERAEAGGATVLPETAAVALLVDDERVVGVRTGDKGRGRDAEETARFEPGSDVRAKVTILAEGTAGHLTGAAVARFGLGGVNAQVWALGVKEVWRVARPLSRVIHTLGWPLRTAARWREFGGSFIYPLGEELVSLGLVVGLDYADAELSVHDLLQSLKLHPLVRELLDGGERVQWGAKTIPEGGFLSLPRRCSAPGLLLCGDAAGFVNVPALKGVHLAVETGRLAAEAAASGELESYDAALRSSWLWAELREVRNVRQAFGRGLWLGGALAGAMTLTRGRFPSRDRRNEPDAAQPVVTGAGRRAPAPDGKLTFDKLSSVFLSGNRTREDQPSHIRIASPVPRELGELWVRMCPAQVYEVGEEHPDGTVDVQVASSNCVQCGAITAKGGRLTPPEGGSGPEYTLT